jgi:beta-glucosidase
MTDWEQAGKFKRNGMDPVYDNAVDHWLRWEEDFDLLKKLNVNAYRFSMDWGRIQPQPDSFDEQALAQYGRMVDRLLELQITPMLTLHHFTHPQWFHEKSPWHQPAAIEAFVGFAEKIAARFAAQIPLFITFNEPIVWLLAAYGDGCFPPGIKDLNLLMTALKHILQAHRRAYDIIKKYNPQAEVGIANNFIVFRPERTWNLLDRGVYALIHNFYNQMILSAFRQNRLRIRLPFLIRYDTPLDLDNRIDFWGVNYYYRLHVRFRLRRQNPFQLSNRSHSGEGLSDLDWEIYARGLGEVLDWLKSSGKPVYITENGIADHRDKYRQDFIKSHLVIVRKYLKRNYPLKGYFYWSLMDNYEWLEGNRACFGLYEVDYNNGKERKLRPSGEFYSAYISSKENRGGG